MKTYILELTKTIIIEVEAASEEQALERCWMKDAFGDSWYYAEPTAKVLDVNEGETA